MEGGLLLGEMVRRWGCERNRWLRSSGLGQSEPVTGTHSQTGPSLGPETKSDNKMEKNEVVDVIY